MRYYKSKIGEVRSEASWKYELDSFWRTVPLADREGHFPKPDDAWERYTKILGLVEVDHEEAESNDDESSSGSWVGVF